MRDENVSGLPATHWVGLTSLLVAFLSFSNECERFTRICLLTQLNKNALVLPSYESCSDKLRRVSSQGNWVAVSMGK